MNGIVAEVNSRLNDEPELINKSPYDDGWLVVLQGEVSDLLDAKKYREKVK
jgi:glycine cleavage system H protein